MTDILKDAPAYRWMTDDAREEGREEGRKAISEQLRATVVAVVAERFPKLARFAKKQISDIEDIRLLQRLVVSMSVATDDDDVKRCLIEIEEEEEQATQ